MSEVKETPLPGVGVRYEFERSAGRRVGIVHHRTGEREFDVYDPRDPDASREVLRLNEEESRTLAELFGTSRVAQDLSKLQQQVEGLAIDWLPVTEASPYAGRTIGDTGARTRTGVSIVAVVRGDTGFPAPGPDFRLEPDDTLVVVGTSRGIEGLAVLLRTG